MKVNFFDLNPINSLIKDEVIKKISTLIDSSSFIDGNAVKNFEQEFADFCGAKYCVCVNNGTSALHLALKSIGKNLSTNKVATPPNSFFATSAAIKYCNIDPLFIDTNDSQNIDTKKLSEQINEYDGVLPVSLYGNPCDLSSIDSLAKNNKKFVIHDACQAHGAKHNGENICNYSDATCFSFYPSKNLGTFGEGGAILTNNQSLYEELVQLKNHGQKTRYYHDIIGYNYRMNEIQAEVLSVKLKYLNEWTDERITIANRYRKNLSSNSKIRLLNVNSNDKCVYHLFPIFTEYKQDLINLFNKANIQYGFHYPVPIYDQKPFEYLNLNKKLFPKTESSKSEQISLPLYVGMTNDEIDYVSEVVNRL
jgi:dTDP-4-amino-4,6-dideoxygalactose transaminase